MAHNFDNLRGKKVRKKLAWVHLKESAAHAKQRFTFANLAHEAADKIHKVGTIVADETIDFTKKNKWSIIGIGAVAGLFIARKPITKFVEDLRDPDQF